MIIQQLDHKYFAKHMFQHVTCPIGIQIGNLTHNNDVFGPTSDPTLQPTKAPTPFNVYCNDGIKYKQTYDAEWQYRLYITETAIVRFHTCDTLKLFDMFIKDEQDPNTNYTWTKCGSICVERAQCSETFKNGTYLLQINSAHSFEMKCKETNSPTTNPTTAQPTKPPTDYPTHNPTTAQPTKPPTDYPT
eukprot:402037_1